MCRRDGVCAQVCWRDRRELTGPEVEAGQDAKGELSLLLLLLIMSEFVAVNDKCDSVLRLTPRD